MAAALQTNLSCSAVSHKTSSRESSAYNSQRDIEHGPWEEKPEDSSHKVRFARGNFTQEQTGSSSSALGNPMFSFSCHAL